MASSGNEEYERWSVVIAYYAVMHLLQSVAAKRQVPVGDNHMDTLALPEQLQLPNARSITMKARELKRLCDRARYLRNEGTKDVEWYLPFQESARGAVDAAIELMDEVFELV